MEPGSQLAPASAMPTPARLAVPAPARGSDTTPLNEPAPNLARAAAPWLGLAAFAVVFCASVAAWGLPWSRDRLALWLLAGLAAVSVGNLRDWARGIVVDWAPLLGLLFVYDLGRGYADGVLDGAYVWPQLRFDELLFGGTAPTVLLQRAFFHPGDPRWYDFAAWGIYTSHFFVSLVVAAVLWRVARQRFRRFAAAFVSLTLVGFVTYVIAPAVPPWLASANGWLEPTYRLAPQMWRYVGVEPAAIIFEGGNRYANDVAALPSLHAAYPLLILLFFWPSLRRSGRLVLGAYVLAMGITLVYAAEHYVADLVLGWVYAIGVYATLSRIWARRDAVS